MKDAQGQASKGYRILVVEDEGLIAHDIARRLETLGHSVIGTVSTAEEAVAQSAGADLVLMDIRIDGEKDGIDAANEIRARYHVPTVFLTAHADKSTLERAKLAGPFGYIVKPLGPAILQASVEMAVYRHATERQLEEREAWLRTTLESAAEAILSADPKGRVLLMNAAAESLTGWTQAEAHGKPLDTVLPLCEEATGKDVRDLALLAILRDAPLILDRALHLTAKAGKQTLVEGSIAPVRTSAGIAGVVVSLRDAGARRWQEQQLRQAQRTHSAARLAASVAADFGSVVGIIRNQAGQLMAQFGEYSPARVSIHAIHEASIAADQIIRRLSSFGTREPAQQEMLTLNGLLRRLSKLIESVAAGRLSVAIHPRSGAGPVLADAAGLEQAVMSLVLHACAVTAPGGTLLVEAGVATQPAAHASLTFTYSAIEPDPEHLFDPSDAADAGLALAVAQAIVTEQRGFLAVRALPDGTEIQLLLPIVDEPVSAGAVAKTARTIVLVEPREHLRAYLHNIVEREGHNLLEASQWEEAAALCEVQESVDLVIAAAADIAALESRLTRPPRQYLRLVEKRGQATGELQTPFTEQSLVALIAALLDDAEQPQASATSS